MKKFFVSLKNFLILYKMGYFLSDSTHKDDSFSDNHNSELWGFIRLNFEKGNIKKYAILDIDFRAHAFSHIHGGINNTSLYRIDLNK